MISLPALVKSLPFQSTIFRPTWSLIRLKAFLLLQPTKRDKPRYVSCCWTIWALKVSLKNSWISCLIFLLKKREVFSLFNFCPNSFSYSANTLATCSQSLNEAWQKIMLSFTKKMWDILGSPLLTDMPLILSSLSFLLNIADNPFAHRRNKYGEIGSPWQRPLDGVIASLGSPLINTE